MRKSVEPKGTSSTDWGAPHDPEAHAGEAGGSAAALVTMPQLGSERYRRMDDNREAAVVEGGGTLCLGTQLEAQGCRRVVWVRHQGKAPWAGRVGVVVVAHVVVAVVMRNRGEVGGDLERVHERAAVHRVPALRPLLDAQRRLQTERRHERFPHRCEEGDDEGSVVG